MKKPLSTKLINRAKKAFKKLAHKNYDWKSFLSGFLLGYANKFSKFECIYSINKMEKSVIECLEKLENGYAYHKWYISKKTSIPEDILTVILKRLKDKGKIKLLHLFNESNGLTAGSGYCLNKN